MTHFLITLALHHPKTAGLIGLFLAMVFGVMGVSSYMEMQKIGDTPQDATLSSIVTYLRTHDRYWVTIKDGSFDCQSIYYEQVGSSDNTEIFLDNPDKSIAMLVTYTEELSCADIESLTVQGVVYPMSERHRSLLKEAGRLGSYSSQTDLVQLCTVCSQSNSKLLVILSLTLTPLSLSLYPFVLWGRKKTGKVKVADSADEIFDSPKDV